jgi:hypothetical protein
MRCCCETPLAQRVGRSVARTGTVRRSVTPTGMRILQWYLVVALTVSGGAAAQPRREIARAIADFDRDGHEDVLSIEALSARPINDRQPWCGAGRKDTGRVDVTVRLGGRNPRTTDLNALFKESSLSFTAGRWPVVVADYNGDGRPDFNLGQYGGCNGWSYAIFTVLDNGAVSRLEVVGGGVRVIDFANSTRALEPIRGGFVAKWYDNSRGHVRGVYCWSAPTNQFVLRRETVGDSTPQGTKQPAASSAAGCEDRH